MRSSFPARDRKASAWAATSRRVRSAARAIVRARLRRCSATICSRCSATARKRSCARRSSASRRFSRRISRSTPRSGRSSARSSPRGIRSASSAVSWSRARCRSKTRCASSTNAERRCRPRRSERRGGMSAVLGLELSRAHGLARERAQSRRPRRAGELQLADANRHQRRLRRRPSCRRGDARRRRQTRRSAQRLGRVAQRADGAGGRAACAPPSKRARSRCRRSTSSRTSTRSRIATSTRSSAISSGRSSTKCAGTTPPSGCSRIDLDMVVEFGASGVLERLMKRMPAARRRRVVVSDFAGVERLQRRTSSRAAGGRAYEFRGQDGAGHRREPRHRPRDRGRVRATRRRRRAGRARRRRTGRNGRGLREAVPARPRSSSRAT